MRKAMNPRKDKKMFSRNSRKTKAINLGVTTYRGGIRM